MNTAVVAFQTAFMLAIAPYHERIKAYFEETNGGSPERFELWKRVMERLTDWSRNESRNKIIAKYAKAGKKIVVVIPERAHPGLCLKWLRAFGRLVLDSDGLLENTHLIFTGGVVEQRGTDGKMHSFADMYGELNASAMDNWLRRRERGCADWDTKRNVYLNYFPPERVTCENLSQNTGEQACIVASLIMGSNADLVVFLGPNEHIARVALTVHCAIGTYSKVFRTNYLARLENMKILVVPIARNGGWNAETDVAGTTSAMDAFGPLDIDGERSRLFPGKARGEELVERIGEEMYGAKAKTFIMNVTTLEDAVEDPMFELELGHLQNPLTSGRYTFNRHD